MTSQDCGQGLAKITRADIEAPDALTRIFSKGRLVRAFRRITKRDSEDLITNPLKKPLLIEFETALCTQLADMVPRGQWKTGRSYLCLTHKRSGGFRDLVFPTLVDSIVGRCLVDALEPEIIRDDDGKAFSGRTHFSNNREFGDYTSWFSVWTDFSAAVDRAAENDGYTYVYESDVADFFPSIDRDRAIQVLAQRTGAHSSILSLLRYCLESWLPRIQYSPMAGLPIDCHDVSGLVAHNYLKGVDSLFKGRADCEYLRYVDDTVVFAETKESARKASEVHHMKLREIGLNPNASKTSILSVSEYQESRHRNENITLDQLRKAIDVASLGRLANRWYSLDRKRTVSWDKIAKRIYTVARSAKAKIMMPRVFQDIVETPSLANHAMRYLAGFDLGKNHVSQISAIVNRTDLDLEAAIAIARVCADGRFAMACSRELAELSLKQIFRDDLSTPGIGYLKAQWLLVLDKHGNRRQRNQGLEYSPDGLDEQWQLHYALVAIANDEVGKRPAGGLVPLGTSDYQLLLRLCWAARRGTLKKPRQVLNACRTMVNGELGIAARHLPLAKIIMEARHYEDEKDRWLKKLLSWREGEGVRDRVIARHVTRWHGWRTD